MTYITEKNLNIYLNRIKVDPRWMRKTHIIRERSDTFCMCSKLVQGREFVVLTNSKVFKILLELDVVCSCCVRNYNEYVLGDCGDGS